MSAAISSLTKSTADDRPTQAPQHPERKLELDQTVDFAVQLLVEESSTVGWQRVEFLKAVMDAANARLSALEEERELDIAAVADQVGC